MRAWEASCLTCGWEQRANDYLDACELARDHVEECPDASTWVDTIP